MDDVETKPLMGDVETNYGSNHAQIQNSACRLHSFDLMRLVCALHIVCYHYGPPINIIQPVWVVRFCKWGYLWVSFFYFLSGFVLTHSQLQKGTGALGSFSAFLRTRLATLYPYHVLSFVLCAVCHLWLHTWTVKYVLVRIPINLLMLQAWNIGYPSNPALNGPSYYISALAFHWVVWFFMFRQFQALQQRQCLVLLSISLVVVIVQQFLNGYPQAKNPISSLPVFIVGMCAAKLCYSGQLWCKDSSWVAPVALLWILLWMVFVERPEQLSILRSPPDRLTIMYNSGVCVILLLQLMFMCGLSSGKDVLSQMLPQEVCRWGSRVSYGLFMIQEPVKVFSMYIIVPKLASWGVSSTSAFFGVILPALVGLVLLSNRLVDDPLRKLLAPPAAATAAPDAHAVADYDIAPRTTVATSAAVDSSSSSSCPSCSIGEPGLASHTEGGAAYATRDVVV